MPETTITTIIKSLAAVKKFCTLEASFTLRQLMNVIITDERTKRGLDQNNVIGI